MTRSLPTVVIALLLFTSTACLLFGVQPVKVEGTTMAPTLNDGDRIIIDRKFEKLQRGDIVVFLYPKDPVRSYIKRIVGLPTETVEIREGKVFVNGQPLLEPYLDPKLDQDHRSSAELRLDADSYYVVGDNRDNSADSRIWGPLPRKFIYGKYTRKYYDAR